MGIIKDAMTEVVKDIATDVGLSAAEGALDVAEKGTEAGGKATGFISKKISDIKDNRRASCDEGN